MGAVGLMDKIRDDAASTIKNLKAQGMRTVMLTGNNESTAKAVSSSIGLDNYHAGLLPEKNWTSLRIWRYGAESGCYTEFLKDMKQGCSAALMELGTQ